MSDHQHMLHTERYQLLVVACDAESFSFRIINICSSQILELVHLVDNACCGLDLLHLAIVRDQPCLLQIGLLMLTQNPRHV